MKRAAVDTSSVAIQQFPGKQLLQLFITESTSVESHCSLEC